MTSNKVRKERSKFKEVERIYFCKHPNCSKGYGRLNHLNDHIKIQRHGEIRKPSEFALVRKQLKRRKLQEEILQETIQGEVMITNSTPSQVEDVELKMKTSLPPIFVTTQQLPLSPSQYSPPSHIPFFPPSRPQTSLKQPHVNTLPLPSAVVPAQDGHQHQHHPHHQYMAAAALPSPPTILPPLNYATMGAGYASYDQIHGPQSQQHRPQLH